MSLMVPGLLTVAAVVSAILMPSAGAGWWLKGIVWAAAGLGILMLLAQWQRFRRPRLACDGEHLLIDTTAGKPVAVPLEVVECFLLGQGPAFLPGRKLARAETVNVVVRLAEKAESWQRGPIHPVLGAWCDGYITLRGTFCEPLSVEVVQRLNRLLGESRRAQRQHRQLSQPPASSVPAPCESGPSDLTSPGPCAERVRGGASGTDPAPAADCGWSSTGGCRS